jgi:hypothetical protein
MPRLLFSVKLAVACRVPPLITSCPGVALLGAVPRLLSALMLSTPPLMVVVPEYVLAPPSVNVPPPVKVRPVLPATTELTVSEAAAATPMFDRSVTIVAVAGSQRFSICSISGL